MEVKSIAIAQNVTDSGGAWTVLALDSDNDLWLVNLAAGLDLAAFETAPWQRLRPIPPIESARAAQAEKTILSSRTPTGETVLFPSSEPPAPPPGNCPRCQTVLPDLHYGSSCSYCGFLITV